MSAEVVVVCTQLSDVKGTGRVVFLVLKKQASALHCYYTIGAGIKDTKKIWCQKHKTGVGAVSDAWLAHERWP